MVGDAADTPPARWSQRGFQIVRGMKPLEHHHAIDNATHLLYALNMTSAQFKRWLEKQGCRFEPAKGGHLRVFLSDRASVLPMHGPHKEIGKGLEHRIKKDLGLK